MLEGQAEQWVGEEKKLLGPGEMALIPPGMPHMTLNPGPGPLKFLAILNNIRRLRADGGGLLPRGALGQPFHPD